MYLTVHTTPKLKDLYQYVTPQYATHWRIIGTRLGLSTPSLDIIEYDHNNKASGCCNAVFEKWLCIDTTASWKKLFAITESPIVSDINSDQGYYYTT